MNSAHRTLLLKESDKEVPLFEREWQAREVPLQVESTEKGALSTLFDGGAGLVLVEHRRRETTGFEWVRDVSVFYPDLPIVLLTDRTREPESTLFLPWVREVIARPFTPAELFKTVSPLMRPLPPPKLDTLAFNIDLVRRDVAYNDQWLQLTKSEFLLFGCLWSRPSTIISRDDIHAFAWGHAFDRGTNLVDVYVGYLRKKLHTVGAPALIASIRGQGYRFD